jgi:hypothetical protein
MEQKTEAKKNEKSNPDPNSEAKISKANEKSDKKNTTQTKAITSKKKVEKNEKNDNEEDSVKGEVVHEEEEIHNIVKNELSMAPTINKNVLFKEIVNKPQHTLNYKQILSHTVVKPVIIEEVKTREPIIMSGSMNFKGLDSMNDEEILKHFFSNNSDVQIQDIEKTNNNSISQSYHQPSHQQVNSGLSPENKNNLPQNYSVNYNINSGNEQRNYYNNNNKQVSQTQQVQKRNIILSHKNNAQTNANVLNQNYQALNANPNTVLHQNNMNIAQMKISNSVMLNQNNVKNNLNLHNSQNIHQKVNVQNNNQKIINKNPNQNIILNNNQILSKSSIQKTQNAQNISSLVYNKPQLNTNANASLNLNSIQEQNQIHNIQKVQNPPNFYENNMNIINMNTNNAAQSKLPQTIKVESRENKILFQTNYMPLNDVFGGKLTRSEIKENKIEIQTDQKNSILLSDEKVSPTKKLYRTNILSKSLRPVVKLENVTVNNILRSTYAKLLKQKKIEERYDDSDDNETDKRMPRDSIRIIS